MIELEQDEPDGDDFGSRYAGHIHRCRRKLEVAERIYPRIARKRQAGDPVRDSYEHCINALRAVLRLPPREF
jgi:hypothetical protein